MERSLGYAVSREAYNRYKKGEKFKIENERILKEGDLDPSADFIVLSQKEWEDISGVSGFDREVIVGRAEIHIVLEKGEIEKKFSVPVSEVLFNVIKIVIFQERMREEEFVEGYFYRISPEIELKDRIVTGDTERVKIEIEKKKQTEKKEEKTSQTDGLSNGTNSTNGANRANGMGNTNNPNSTLNNPSQSNSTLSEMDNPNNPSQLDNSDALDDLDGESELSSTGHSEQSSTSDSQSSNSCHSSQLNSSGNQSSNYSALSTRPSSFSLSARPDCTPVEFRNVGLTCYMNTALQVLLGVSELSSTIEEMSKREIDQFKRRRNTKKGYNREKSGELLLAYKELIRTVREKGDCLIRLKEIKRVLGSIDSRYRGCTEEDAGEAFSLILSNFSYLLEKTKYDRLISDLFLYRAESVEIVRGKETVKELYKSFVLNGSFGSEGGHFHVLVVNRDQLVWSRLCVHFTRRISVGKIIQRILENFRLERRKVVGVRVDGERVIRLKDDYEFNFEKSLFNQPIFYITEKTDENIEFVFLKYSSVDGLSFFSSFFSGGRNLFEIPFLVGRRCNLAEFLEGELRINRRTEVPDTVLDIQESSGGGNSYFSSIVISFSNKHWDLSEYIEIVKTRRYGVKESINVQCVVSNWETRTERKIDGVVTEEFTRFRGFSRYFCVQLPVGLGRPFKGEKDRQKLLVEKDGLVLDGVSYSLAGILVHHSFGIGGHYVAFTKRNGIWYHCNDSTISKSSVNEAVTTGYPYGILYRKTEEGH